MNQATVDGGKFPVTLRTLEAKACRQTLNLQTQLFSLAQPCFSPDAVFPPPQRRGELCFPMASTCRAETWLSDSPPSRDSSESNIMCQGWRLTSGNWSLFYQTPTAVFSLSPHFPSPISSWRLFIGASWSRRQKIYGLRVLARNPNILLNFLMLRTS